MFGKNENVIFSLCSSLASVAQLVEHVFRKDGVVGSIPTAGSSSLRAFVFIGATD